MGPKRAVIAVDSGRPSRRNAGNEHRACTRQATSGSHARHATAERWHRARYNAVLPVALSLDDVQEPVQDGLGRDPE